MSYHHFLLDNGLHLLHIPVPGSKVVHAGFVINAGSRDETDKEAGLAHFIEHMLFKGTAKRKTFHILNYLESVGGDLDAYTTREKTCIYASLSREHLKRAFELLPDLIFHSSFPEKEIEKEKQVIAEEIDMYRDTPEEAILEDFDELTFAGQALGRPVLGYKKTINRFSRRHLNLFLEKNYTQKRTLFAVSGDLSEKKIRKLAEKYLEPLSLPPFLPRNGSETVFHPVNIIQQKPINQAHQVIGGEGWPLFSEEYFTLSLLINYLGGPAMNSRLNLNIRERYGLTYNIYTFYNAYVDAGSWGIYFGCEPGNAERVNKLVLKELKSLRESKMSDVRLGQIRKQMKGQLVLSNEKRLSGMLRMSKDILDFGRPLELSEVLKKIDRITPEDVLKVSNLAFDPQKIAQITYLPENGFST